MNKKVLFTIVLILFSTLQVDLFAQVSGITSGGIYQIASKNSGRVLNVSNASMSNSANVDIWVNTKSDAERWIVTYTGNNNQYTLTNVASGKLLHLASMTPANSVNVNQYDNTNDNTVKWQIVSNGSGYFSIQSVVDPAYVLNVDGTGATDGTNVSIYQGSGNISQLWNFYPETTQEVSPSAGTADQIFAAWRTKFYDNNRKGNQVIANEGFWGVAEMMEIVDDAFEVTGKTKYATLFGQMYNQFLIKEGQDWMWNDYNDDIAWMIIACTRASLLTGNTAYQIKAKEQFDKMYARAIHDGSWLTWKEDRVGGIGAITSTNSCINGPAMVACCYLAQAFNDPTYYDKAIALYRWSKGKLFISSSGKVNDNYNVVTGVTSTWSSTYNQGTYLGAALMLYNYTQDPIYLLDAQRIAKYTKENMFSSGVINGESGRDLDGFKGIFMRYARRYVVDCNKTDYIPWLQLNAKVAYNNRNSENLIGTKWGTRAMETSTLPIDTVFKYIGGFATSTAVSLMVNCPYSTSIVKSAYQTIEAENFNYLRGVSVEACPEGTSNLGGVMDGYYTAYNNIDFGLKGSALAQFRIATISGGNTIEIRLGSPTGRLVGTATTINTNPGATGWANYQTISCPVANVKGLQNIYLVYKGGSYICNLNNFKFTEETNAIEGNGLLANYFIGMEFETPVLQRIDKNINFDWQEFSPASEVTVDNFSARWTGKIQPKYTGNYTFYITSDNGRRVWINNQLIIDKWINDWDIPYMGTINLTAGQKYDIKVEYFEVNGGAGIKLEWESLQQVREVIPNSQLFLPSDALSGMKENHAGPAEGLTFYPNPVDKQLNIDFAGMEAKQVSIYNAQGKLFFQINKKASGVKTYDVSTLSKGVYLVTVLTSKGEKKTLKFVK